MLNQGIKKALRVVLALMTVGEGSIFGASSMVVTYEVAGVMTSPVLSSYTYDFNSIGAGSKSTKSLHGVPILSPTTGRCGIPPMA